VVEKLTSSRWHDDQMANERNLRPFNDTEEGRERARELGRKGGLERARRAAEKREAEQANSLELHQALDRLSERFNRDDLGETAANVALMLMAKVANGEIEVTGRDVSNLIQVLVNVTRLEEGQATSHETRLVVSGAEAMERINALRARAEGQTAEALQPVLEENYESGGERLRAEVTGDSRTEGGQGRSPGDTPTREI
jgi:hypothetical protein